MKRERGLYFIALTSLLFLILFSSFILAATNTTNVTAPSTANFEKSYTCLSKLVDSKIDSGLTNEELSFSLLALAYDSSLQSKLVSKLEDKRGSNSCWPKNACTLKDTAQVLLAYNNINKDTSEIENWLSNQTAAPSDLVWYLQIDSDSQDKAECTITYDGTARKVYVNQDKTISGTFGTCFNSAYNGIWLEVSQSCYGKEFEISCNKDFLTNLIYKKRTSQTYYISALTNTAAIGGKTTEKVESACFKQSGSCNYEGSLWAALALQRTGNDITKFLPYLLTMGPDNQRYAPSAFLYVLTTGFDEYFTEVINAQTKEGYWQYSDTSKRYYDTALSILSLGTNDAAQKAKDYLLSSKVQGDGCYNNNIRDTAFVVYAASPKTASTVTPVKTCASNSDFSCITSSQCDSVNGSIQTGFTCLGLNICCNKKFTQKSCNDLGGKTCLSSEECTGTLASGLNGCCLSGICQIKQEQDQCTIKGTEYSCKTSCDSTTEDSTSFTCPEQGTCCMIKSITTPTGGSSWWIWLLVILIILLILAIIFRDQLKIYWFKVKSKFSKEPVIGQNRPSFPPRMPPGNMPPQMGMPRRIIPQNMPPQPQRPFPKDRELDDTLKKLKDMSKQ